MNNYILKQKTLVKELEDSFNQKTHKSTVVDMQNDYFNSKQICLTSVVFIPNDISSKITQNIINPLKEIESEHYFYSPESMHLTIKNVRTVNNPPLFNKSDIEKVNELFNKIVPQFPAFEFNIEDVLLFPTSISVMAYSNDTLQKLVIALNEGLKEIGVPDNKKYISNSIFWGNITVCRFVKNPGEKFVKAIREMRNSKIGRFELERINLVTGNVVLNPETREAVAEYILNNQSKDTNGI